MNANHNSTPWLGARLALLATLPLLMVACPSDNTTGGQSGVATNGHLSGATVTCNASGDTTTTDANGKFTLAKACAGSLTVSGGTNVDTGESFLGEFKAPQGAKAVNALTTMMVSSGLTEAQLKTSLGIASNVDILNTDPAATSGGNYTNSTYLVAAKAVQQVFQTTMESLASTASLDAKDAATATAAKKTMYATIASSMGDQIKVGNKLIDSAAPTVVSTSVVSSAVTSAVTSIKSDASLKTAFTTSGVNAMDTVQPAAFATLASASVAAQAQTFLAVANKPTTEAAGQALASTVQKDNTLASQMLDNKAFLNTTDSTKLAALGSMSTAISTMVTVSTANTDSSTKQAAVSTAQSTLTSAVSSAATANGVAAPSATDFYALYLDSVSWRVDGLIKKYMLSDFTGNGIDMPWPIGASTFAGVSLVKVGAPKIESNVEVAISISQPSKKGAFKAYISGLVLSATSDGLRVQSNSLVNVYAWGQDDSGQQVVYSNLSKEVNALDTTLTQYLTITPGSTTTQTTTVTTPGTTWIPMSDAFTRTLNVVGDNAGVLKSMTGTVNVTVVVKGLPIRYANTSAIKSTSISVPQSLLDSTSVKTLQGYGWTGKINLKASS